MAIYVKSVADADGNITVMKVEQIHYATCDSCGRMVGIESLCLNSHQVDLDNPLTNYEIFCTECE